MSAPRIYCEQLHPTLVVTDVRAAVEFYTSKLGFTLAFTEGDPAMFAGLLFDRVQIFLSRGTPETKGCDVYFVVEDADELFAYHRGNGVEVVDPPADRHYGLRDYVVRDLDGYRLEFGHRLWNAGAATDPLLIERVDVPVRLEKRLAALLGDLAAHKHMTVGSCLEEILLHTCDRTGPDSVPSPHTRRTLDYIQELKKKHAIDYDSHASYRFVERGGQPSKA